MSTLPVVATRVMKARRESECPACRGPIRPGQLIAKCSGGLWQHASCFIGHQHNRDTSEIPARSDQCPGAAT